jgi:hypothetical protein
MPNLSVGIVLCNGTETDLGATPCCYLQWGLTCTNLDKSVTQYSKEKAAPNVTLPFNYIF